MAAKEKYASVISRFVAILVDGIILFVAQMFLTQLFGRSAGMRMFMGPLQMILGFAYFIYFTSKDGQTPGKKLMKIKVVTELGGKIPDMTSLVLRETVGRMLSSFVLMLGYIWAIFDSKKQGWHDKLGKTVVVNV